MKNYLSQNAKIKAMSGPKTFNWGIPAYRSESGFVTCPYAGQCATGCYARMGAYVWPAVKAAYEARLALARSPEFVATLDAEIKRRKVERIRIHDSGDFFSPRYRDAWLEIMRRNPSVRFYAYTKAIPLFQGIVIPDNFELIFSEGGKFDNLIDDRSMKHSRVFESVKALKQAGYSNASKDDNVAAAGESNKIGLVYHGFKSRTWTTGRKVA